MYTEFEKILRSLVITLRDRALNECQSQEVSTRFQEVLNCIEVASAAAAVAGVQDSLETTFKKQFVRPGLIQQIRQRDAVRGVTELHEIAAENQKDNKAKGKGESGESELIDALCCLTPDMMEKIMPWTLLDKLFDIGAKIKTSETIPPRVISFNEKYDEFLENMEEAFPRDDTDSRDSLVEHFRMAIMYDPCFVFEKYKELAMPYIGSLNNPTQSREVYLKPNVFFGKLPYLQSLPLEKYWRTQIIETEENYDYLSETFAQLLIGIAGLPMGLFSKDLLGTVKEYVQKNLKDSPAPTLNADGSIDMQQVMGSAMNIMQEMQANGTIETMLENLGPNASFDLDEEMLQQITQSIDMPDEIQAALEGSVASNQPVFGSTGTQKIKDN